MILGSVWLSQCTTIPGHLVCRQLLRVDSELVPPASPKITALPLANTTY